MTDTPSNEIMLHGNMMIIHGVGTFITGEPGIGKSHACLSLIKAGQIFISDDAVLFKTHRHCIEGSAPERIRGKIYTKESGMIDIKERFTKPSTKESAPLSLVIKLQNNHDKDTPKINTKKILNRDFPYVTVPTDNKETYKHIETTVKQYLQRHDHD